MSGKANTNTKYSIVHIPRDARNNHIIRGRMRLLRVVLGAKVSFRVMGKEVTQGAYVCGGDGGAQEHVDVVVVGRQVALGIGAPVGTQGLVDKLVVVVAGRLAIAGTLENKHEKVED
jgi:hypothetical protein